MKRINLIRVLTIVMIMIFSIGESLGQDKETEFKIYIPLRTYHYDRTPDYEYDSTEGGNLGVIGIYRRTNGKWFQDIIVGGLRNSYGNFSVAGQYGVGKHFGKFDISFNLGLISGYKSVFEDKVTPTTYTIYNDGIGYEKEYNHTTVNTNEYRDILPNFFTENGIIPAVNLSLTYDTGLISPLLIISPEYINGGILIKF